MANNFDANNISPDKIEAMLRMASNKLGMSPDQLKGVLSDKKATSDLLDQLGAKSKVEAVEKDPEALKKLINNNPKAKKMLEDLMGDKKNG